MKAKAVFYLLALSLALPMASMGAGFHIREQGAKAMGMANAFVAQADDPSAVFYNPAGIAFQEGTAISLGVTIINVPETEFKGTTYSGDRAVFDFAYMWVDFDDRDVNNKIQTGTYKSDAHLFAANLTYFF